MQLPETSGGDKIYMLLGCIDRASQALGLETDADLVVKVSLYFSSTGWRNTRGGPGAKLVGAMRNRHGRASGADIETRCDIAGKLYIANNKKHINVLPRVQVGDDADNIGQLTSFV